MASEIFVTIINKKPAQGKLAQVFHLMSLFMNLSVCEANDVVP